MIENRIPGLEQNRRNSTKNTSVPGIIQINLSYKELSQDGSFIIDPYHRKPASIIISNSILRNREENKDEKCSKLSGKRGVWK